MQSFRVESEKIRDKLNNLLPSQNRGAIGVELSGSTQIVPIVDLTEIAEGSALRQDLQRSLSLTAQTAFNVTNATTTIINTTGYFNVRGRYNGAEPGGLNVNTIQLTDGTTTKIIDKFSADVASGTGNIYQDFDFDVFLKAGDSLTITSASTLFIIAGSTRQIADLSGNLVNP